MQHVVCFKFATNFEMGCMNYFIYQTIHNIIYICSALFRNVHFLGIPRKSTVARTALSIEIAAPAACEHACAECGVATCRFFLRVLILSLIEYTQSFGNYCSFHEYYCSFHCL